MEGSLEIFYIQVQFSECEEIKKDSIYKIYYVSFKS